MIEFNNAISMETNSIIGKRRTYLTLNRQNLPRFHSKRTNDGMHSWVKTWHKDIENEGKLFDGWIMMLWIFVTKC